MTPPPGADELVVRRVLRVPRERVFAAWLDAALMARWMCPGDTRSATVELDPQVGGTFRIVIVAKLDAVLARTDRLPP